MKQNQQNLPTAVAMATINRAQRVIISGYQARSCSINTPANSIICRNSCMWHENGAKMQKYQQVVSKDMISIPILKKQKMRGSHGGDVTPCSSVQ
jgi:hypothetical protein